MQISVSNNSDESQTKKTCFKFEEWRVLGTWSIYHRLPPVSRNSLGECDEEVDFQNSQIFYSEVLHQFSGYSHQTDHYCLRNSTYCECAEKDIQQSVKILIAYIMICTRMLDYLHITDVNSRNFIRLFYYTFLNFPSLIFPMLTRALLPQGVLKVMSASLMVWHGRESQVGTRQLMREDQHSGKIISAILDEIQAVYFFSNLCVYNWPSTNKTLGK